MNLKGFFVATLQSALDLGIAVPEDVLRHVTPDVLAAHLPRPLWARLITACLGASRVDAQLVVETVGLPNLCEHVPVPIIWGCIQEIGVRALGGVVMATPGSSTRPQGSSTTSSSRPIPLATPPPPEPRAVATPPAAVGPSIPAPVTAAVGTAEHETDGARSARLPPGQRFRPSSTGIGRLAASNSARRPQAQATPPPTPPSTEPSPERAGGQPPRAKRTHTEADFDLETFVGGKDDWKNALAVEDEQLVDWAASDETQNNDELSRKR